MFALGVAVGVYFLLQPYVGTEEVGWMCILAAAPFAACGFFSYHGILCTPGEDGCTLYAPDFPNLQITAPTMDAGLLEMKEKLHKALRQYKYPPAPTRQEQIVVPATGFLLLIRVA